MHTVDGIVIVWTAVNTVGLVFSSAMVATRVKNMLHIKNNVHPTTIIERQDRDYRFFVARQDIRRSTLRTVMLTAMILCGYWLAWMQHNQDFTHYSTWSDVFQVSLIIISAVTTVNEGLDRLGLYRLRRMHDLHRGELRGMLQ